MGKRNSSSKRGTCLFTCLKILAVIFLFPIIAGFGWIAGVIWLIFFRKKMNNNLSKQKKYTIGVSIASALSLILFAYSLATPSAQPQTEAFSSIEAENNSELDADLEGFTPTIQPTNVPTPKPTTSVTPQPTKTPTPQPTVAPTLRPTETPQPVLQPTEAPETQTESTPEPQIVTDPAPQPAAVSDSQPIIASSDGNSGSGSGESNFNTYDNPEQQQTADTYVLNTSRYKIHYPSCSSVAKIAPDNYATSNSSIAELEAQGYTTCGNCFK